LFVTDLPAHGDEAWVDRFLRFGLQTPPALRGGDYPVPEGSFVPAPCLRVADSERVDIDAWVNSRAGSMRPLVLVQPGNFRSMSQGRRRWRRHRPDDKAWPIGNWVELLRQVHQRMPEALILLCGAPPEAALLQQIEAAVGSRDVQVAALPLRQLFALCTRAHSMISVDTGPAHAAAAVGLPLVVLFGASPPQVWKPRSAVGSPVIGVGGWPVAKRADEIPEQVVFDAWCGLLERLEADTAAAH